MGKKFLQIPSLISLLIVRGHNAIKHVVLEISMLGSEESKSSEDTVPAPLSLMIE